MAKTKTVIIVSLTAVVILLGAKLANSRFEESFGTQGIIPLSTYIEQMELKYGTETSDGVDEAIDEFNSELENS